VGGEEGVGKITGVEVLSVWCDLYKRSAAQSSSDCSDVLILFHGNVSRKVSSFHTTVIFHLYFMYKVSLDYKIEIKII
jgi:hypothetical protein